MALKRLAPLTVGGDLVANTRRMTATTGRGLTFIPVRSAASKHADGEDQRLGAAPSHIDGRVTETTQVVSEVPKASVERPVRARVAAHRISRPEGLMARPRVPVDDEYLERRDNVVALARVIGPAYQAWRGSGS